MPNARPPPSWGAVSAPATARSPEQITFAKGAVAGTVNLILGLLIASSGGLEVRQIAAALVIGALGYGASITLWVKGARDLGAARGQVIFAAAPFIGGLLSWTVLHESIAAVQLVAVPIAAAGVAASLRTSHEHAHRHEPIEHEHEHTHGDGHHEHTHAGAVAGRHTHRHLHESAQHVHDHVPDLHHGHTH